MSAELPGDDALDGMKIDTRATCTSPRRMACACITGGKASGHDHRAKVRATISPGRRRRTHALSLRERSPISDRRAGTGMQP